MGKAESGSPTWHLSEHAEAMLLERGIEREWVAAALAQPDWSRDDPARPYVRHAFRKVAERGGKTLRVVHVQRDGETLVTTVYFDRNARPPKDERRCE